jgi:sugar lactone lactonase YvrE
MANWNRVIEMPVQNPTTCAFGGVNLRTLYVTSAEIMMKSADRLAGTVFELGVAAQGTPEHRFRLG